MQARSIVEGTVNQFMEKNRFTIENSARLLGPVAYPWGTPLLLAPLYKLFGLNMLALKSLNVACFILFLASLSFFLRDRHSFLFLVLLVSFFAFNPTLLASLDSVLSDIPFLLFSTVSVFLIGRTAIEGRPLLGNAIDNFLLGVLLAAAFFTRTNGLLLVFTLLGTHVIKIMRELGGIHAEAGRRSAFVADFVSGAGRPDMKRLFIDLLPYITFIVLTLILSFAFPQGWSSHLPFFGSVSLGTIRYHVRFYGEIPSDFFFGIPHHHVLYVASFPFLLAGMVRSARRDYHMILYMVLTALLYMLWPFTQGLRFVFPLLPFYFHFMFIGIRWGFEAIGGSAGVRWRFEAIRSPGRTIGQVLAVCVLVSVTFFFMKDSVSQVIGNLRNHRSVASGPYAETSRDVFEFIMNNIGKDDVIVFFKPRLMRMITDRQSIMITGALELKRGDYLCIYLKENAFDQLPLADVDRLVREGQIVPIYANPDFRIFRIANSREGGASSGGSGTSWGGSGAAPLRQGAAYNVAVPMGRLRCS
jgi:hypothetical protein